MTPAQTVIENERKRAGMVTTPQANAEMQRGQADMDAQDIAMQHAYRAWLATPEGQAARDEWLRHPRETLAERANHDDKLFEQLCADDAEALRAHEDEAYLTRYGL